MSIMEIVYLDKFTDLHRSPAWARAERYEYCEDTLTAHKTEKKGTLLQRITAGLFPAK